MVRLSKNYPAPANWHWCWNRETWNHDGHPVCIKYKDAIRVYFSKSLCPSGFIGEIPLKEALPYLENEDERTVSIGTLTYKIIPANQEDFRVIESLSDGGYFSFYITLGLTKVGDFEVMDFEKILKVEKETPTWPLKPKYSTKDTQEEWENKEFNPEKLL